LYSKLPCPDVRLSTRVASVDVEGCVRLGDGEELRGDAIVIATNYHTARRWITAEQAGTDSRFARLERLTSVPILGAHLTFDRPVLARSHVAFMQGPLQWLFRKNAQGSAVHGVISAAREWVNRPKEECLALFEEQVKRTIPAAASAKLVRGVIVIEKRATFSPLPGVERLRPAQAPSCFGMQRVYLAGDWTATGWPATMEGAVRSGYLAADAIVEKFKLTVPAQRRFLVDDLPVEWPARMLGFRRLPKFDAESCH
jgi:zeta-carotene desaturase